MPVNLNGNSITSGTTFVSGSSQISLASTNGFGTYLNQAVLTSSSPSFATTTINGNINYTYSQGTTRSLYGGGYGGVVQIISDNSTSARNIKVGISDSTNTWAGGLTIDNTLVGSFSNMVNATCPTTSNGDGFRVNASATGAGGSQPGYSYWTAAGSKRFYHYVDITADTWYLANATPTNVITVTQAGNTTIAGTLTENSSIRYKDNIETVKYGLDKVLQMRGVTYTKKDTGLKELGLIAEEVNEILPEVVLKNEEGEPDSVSYGRITAVLIEAIKDLKKEIEELKSNK